MSEIINKSIKISRASLHNLKDVDVEIPHNRLTVITGVSGSGKSTLAFDTLYAEGQRRFVESLSSYARQFLERMGKPDVESIIGLPPAIAIEQRPHSRNPRSTVGTTTELYDYLRLLFGRIGKTKCKKCGSEVKKDTPASVVKSLMTWEESDRLFVCFEPKINGSKSVDIVDKYKTLGFFRVVKAGTTNLIDLEGEGIPEDFLSSKYYFLVDRIVFRKDDESISRLTESIESAFHYGEGRICIINITNQSEFTFSSVYECPDCDIVYLEPEPKLFSFNNPYGACPSCQGFGRTIGIDADLVVPDKSLSLKKHAIHPFKGEKFAKHETALLKIAKKYDIPVNVPIVKVPKDKMEIIWNGADDYIGLKAFFKYLESKSYKMHYRVMLSKYRGYTECEACSGSRLRTSARQVFVEGKNITELIKMPLGTLNSFFQTLQLGKFDEMIAGQLLIEIKWRLQLLVDIGLEYLTLSRLTHTLSGGEAQRINLTTALGSSLVGTLYVLDEPSIGMHPRDTDRLLNILFKLRGLGNTVVVVEHDPDIIKYADKIIDMGPNAGEFGGEVVYSGSFEDLSKATNSLTSDYFSGRKQIAIPNERKAFGNEKITIHNAQENNLSIEKVEFPLGCMTCVTGVSGSGKSTLIHDILYAGIKKYKGGYMGHTGRYERIEGMEHIEVIEMVDQSPIGKSSRSTPATYTKVFDAIRDVFAQTQLARQLSYKPGHFSFNVAGGRCDECEGEGTIKVDMQFLPDVTLICESCKGTRYKKEIHNILYKDKTIVDVLNMTVDDALVFFEDKSKITKKLQILQDVGLGYLRLGQPSTHLSGGEAQRIKLAGHLDAKSGDKTLFIFDEPTTGLHLDDISKLINSFKKLTDTGHSVVIIEHNLHVIASADYIIDLGPEAGENGGKIVITGTPEEVAECSFSYTGKYLKEFFSPSV
jgi:excinuclease ABC subunit A